MKRIKFIYNCICNQIKKKIFKLQKTDISHECEKLMEEGPLDPSIEELVNSEEYAKSYCVTTRWQTL